MSHPVIELTKQLISRPSLSPYDAGCQELIIKRLLSIGFTVDRIDIDDTKNFWARHGHGETLAFAGHTDVAPVGDIDRWISPPFQPTIRDGVLFGRGAADMKGSLAAMVVATERFIIQYPGHKNRLAFIITSDEESSAKNGTIKVVEELIKRKERLDYCLIGEPSSTEIIGDVIKNGRRGSLTCNLTIHGIQGHIAYPHLVDNPIHRAAPFLNELVTVQWDYGNEFFPPTSMQIYDIHTMNSNYNVTPDELFIQFNFRFSTELTEKIIKKKVETLLNKYQIKYTVNWLLHGQPFLTKHGKMIDVITNVIKYFNGIQPQILTTGGTSDGRFISRIGSQVVELGLVNTTIHKTNECVSVADLKLLSCIYQRIIEQLVT